MGAAADVDAFDTESERRWPMRAVFAVVAAALIAGAGFLVKRMLDTPDAPKRQVAKISILPDTPPPPPPPPKEEKKPEPPKAEPKQVMREEQVKQEVQKQPDQQIKMEGQAGDGPSAFAAGSVTQEYKGGTPGSGDGGGLGRLAFTTYANGVTRALNEHLARDRDLKQHSYRVSANLWLTEDGRVQRVELIGSSGDPEFDRTLRGAIERFQGTSGRLPDRMPQPIRVVVTNRLLS